MNIGQQQQQKQQTGQYNKPYVVYPYQHLQNQQTARPNSEMTPNTHNATNPQVNVMSDQHRYMIPPPFGNMQFAAQRRQRSQTPMHQQLPNQSQQQEQNNQQPQHQQTHHQNYPQGQPPMEQGQAQVPYYQGVPPMSQGQQYCQQNMMRRMLPTHMLSSYSVRKYLSNMAILRVHEVINQINLSMGKVDDYQYWSKFTKDIFTPHGVMRYARKNGDDTRLFEFAMPIIPSLLKFLGSTGVVRIELVPQQLRVQVLSNGTIFFECPRCTVTYFYPDGSYMTNFSQIKGIFDSALKIEWCDICTYSFVPGIEWNSLERVLSDQKVSYQIFQALSDPNSQPHHRNEENKDYSSQKRDAQQPPSNFSAITQLRSQFKVFHNISSFGIHESFMRVLQVNDVMSYLESLKICQKLNNIRSPLESLSTFVAASEESRVGTGQSMKPSSVNLNGVATNMSQTMGTPQPQTPSSSSSFLNTMPYKHQERKPMKKRKSTDALSPTTTSDSTKSPAESSNNENIANPYKKVKF